MADNASAHDVDALEDALIVSASSPPPRYHRHSAGPSAPPPYYQQSPDDDSHASASYDDEHDVDDLSRTPSASELDEDDFSDDRRTLSADDVDADDDDEHDDDQDDDDDDEHAEDDRRLRVRARRTQREPALLAGGGGAQHRPRRGGRRAPDARRVRAGGPLRARLRRRPAARHARPKAQDAAPLRRALDLAGRGSHVAQLEVQEEGRGQRPPQPHARQKAPLGRPRAHHRDQRQQEAGAHAGHPHRVRHLAHRFELPGAQEGQGVRVQPRAQGARQLRPAQGLVAGEGRFDPKARQRVHYAGRHWSRVVSNVKKSGAASIGNREEQAVLRKLEHPNIVSHRDILLDSVNDGYVVVVEYMARGVVMDSSKLEGVKPLSEDGVREIMRDVVSGLEYLHHQRIAHRDIKPDNLLRAGDGTVKLSDFGEARMYDVSSEDPRSKSPAPGTPAFIAPELCMSERSPKAPPESYAADIWSLGASLFYMVYGRAPFLAKNVFEIYDCICTQRLRFPDQPKVSRKLKDLIKKMLVKEPKNRATLQDVARHAWFNERIVQKEELKKIRITPADIESAIGVANWSVPAGREDND
ncbi:Serine/threonine protein kinase [Gracilaria domingensis]|nr:Serine/threonine protein kinase [Gracilaria domingensis]